jgi:hypothetical protein
MSLEEEPLTKIDEELYKDYNLDVICIINP